jgi:hypothetical protein
MTRIAGERLTTETLSLFQVSGSQALSRLQSQSGFRELSH